MHWKIRSGLYLACTFAEAAAVVAVHRVRRFLHLPARTDSTGVFLGVFLRHALGRERTLRITCAERTDGAGAQAHTIMSAMCFAQARGHTYVHTPFTQIDHAERPMDGWVAAWEQLFNLGEGEIPCNAAAPRAINYSTFHPRLYHGVMDCIARLAGRARQGERHFQPFLYFSDGHPEAYMEVIPKLRRKYYRNSSPVRNRIIRIAIHMRRGDVTPAHRERFTPTAAMLATTRRVGALLERHAQEHAIELYSQGTPDEFAEFRASGVELFLNVDAVRTMSQLIEADVLIMSRSSFSYVAALISDGVKLYEPFWHSPLKEWITRNQQGGFDEQKFQAQLADLIMSREPGASEHAAPGVALNS